jgi:YbbR domain-containing protein
MPREKKDGNLGLKALSVLLAVSLWFFVTYRGQSEMALEAPLEFKNIPKGLELLKYNTKKVGLNIRGHERILQGMRPMDVRVGVDLSSAKEGEADYQFNKEDVVLPRGLKVLRMEPLSVRVALDQTVTRVVPVKAYVVGTPERGYRTRSVEVKPQTLTVEGARAEVSKVSLLRTEPIDITGLDSDLMQDFKVNIDGKNIRLSASEVSVTIRLAKEGK